MSQYSSRIHIKVTEPAIWEKFKDVDDAEFGLAGLAEDGSTQELGQGAFAGSFGTGDQIKMGDPAPAYGVLKVFLQPLVS